MLPLATLLTTITIANPEPQKLHYLSDAPKKERSVADASTDCEDLLLTNEIDELKKSIGIFWHDTGNGKGYYSVPGNKRTEVERYRHRLKVCLARQEELSHTSSVDSE